MSVQLLVRPLRRTDPVPFATGLEDITSAVSLTLPFPLTPPLVAFAGVGSFVVSATFGFCATGDEAAPFVFLLGLPRVVFFGGSGSGSGSDSSCGSGSGSGSRHSHRLSKDFKHVKDKVKEKVKRPFGHARCESEEELKMPGGFVKERKRDGEGEGEGISGGSGSGTDKKSTVRGDDLLVTLLKRFKLR